MSWSASEADGNLEGGEESSGSEVDLASDGNDDSDDDFEDEVVVKKKKAPAAAAKKGAASSVKKQVAASTAAKPRARAKPTKKNDNKENISSGEPSKKRKAASGSATAASGKKAKATDTISDAKAAEIIKEYMLKSNRPYSHLNVFDNLHGVIKKASVQKVLNQLCEEGVLQQKDFGKVRIYLANQSNFDEVDQTEMDAIDCEVRDLQSTQSDRKAAVKALQSRVAMLQSRPTSNELSVDVARARTMLQAQQELLNQIAGLDQPLISKEEFARIKTDHSNYLKLWKQRRRACNEMLECILENSSTTRAELMEEIGVEIDAAVGVSLSDHDPRK